MMFRYGESMTIRFGLFAIAIAVLAVVAGACQGGEERRDPVSDEALRVGDCLFYAAPNDIRPVYCFEEHHAEVIAVLTMADGPYPGDNGVNAFALKNCPDETDTFVYPTAETWVIGDRAIACLEEDLEATP